MKKFAEKRFTGFAVALLGLCMIGFGIYRGEVEIVFMKAINICLECIGIG